MATAVRMQELALDAFAAAHGNRCAGSPHTGRNQVRNTFLLMQLAQHALRCRGHEFSVRLDKKMNFNALDFIHRVSRNGLFFQS